MGTEEQDEEGWGLRRGQAQGSTLSGLPGLLGILALLLLGEAAAARIRSGRLLAVCWEWVGLKNPSSPGSWLSEWGTGDLGMEPGASEAESCLQQLKGPPGVRLLAGLRPNTTLPHMHSPRAHLGSVLSHGQDDLCQELQRYALYICDNFLWGGGGSDRDKRLLLQIPGTLVRPSCGLHSPFLRLTFQGAACPLCPVHLSQLTTTGGLALSTRLELFQP